MLLFNRCFELWSAVRHQRKWSSGVPPLAPSATCWLTRNSSGVTPSGHLELLHNALAASLNVHPWQKPGSHKHQRSDFDNALISASLNLPL